MRTRRLGGYWVYDTGAGGWSLRPRLLAAFHHPTLIGAASAGYPRELDYLPHTAEDHVRQPVMTYILAHLTLLHDRLRGAGEQTDGES